MDNKTGEVEAFLYIPDMSGFTEFMATTKPDKSHQIVEEMLRAITESNELELSISDIIGDAVFFYRTGPVPSLEEVIRQSKVISEKFKNQIRAHGSKFNWETNRVEQMHQLNIKFIAHAGKVALSEIEKHTKLIGVPVIEAHKLLKNSVQKKNYLLTTNAYLQSTRIEGATYEFSDGSDEYEHIGEVHYKVLDLQSLPTYMSDFQ